LSSASGASGESHGQAAGSGPASAVNAVYDGRVVPAGDLLRPARRKPRRSWRAAFFALALAGLVGIVAWVFLGSRLLAVRSVVVVGAHLVPRSEVLAVAGVELGTPLVRVNPSQVEARIVTIRQVQGAQVTRAWPDRVVIVIRERTPALAVTAPGGGFDLVDADGVIVRWAVRRPADLPLYPGPGTSVASLRGDPDLTAAAAVLRGLPARLRHEVGSVTAPSPDQVTLQLSGGITVVWGDASDAPRKAQELTVLELTHSHYYDVSAQGTLTTN
jgi:cell division protein FtsQ